jgi:ketosteroid isomerase-like protein
MTRQTSTVSFVLFVSMLAVSCSTKRHEKQDVDYKAEMMDADRSFSKLSEQKGMKYAFMQFIDARGVLLRPNTAPIVGVEAIDFISQGIDTAYTMTWEPNGGSVAKSGDLGYTYGVYSYKPNNRDTVIYGTYVTVWKRQPDGKWKFALETGNEGVE